MLNHIGKAIGNVLRIDTFKATESRGRFARIRIQVDVEKPLITAIMIGKLEQQISYKGIQKLYFGCGRIGHRKENCPYFVRQAPLSVEEGRNEQGDRRFSSHEKRVPDSLKGMEGTTRAVHESEQGTVHQDLYGLWVVVTCRKKGTKNQRSGGTPPGLTKDFVFKSTVNVEAGSPVRVEVQVGPTRERVKGSYLPR